jgi:hypothetical protein
VHTVRVEVEGIGELEAYPNGDATKLAVHAGLDPGQLKHLGCHLPTFTRRAWISSDTG